MKHRSLKGRKAKPPARLEYRVLEAARARRAPIVRAHTKGVAPRTAIAMAMIATATVAAFVSFLAVSA